MNYIIKNIKNFFQTNRLFFILFMICQITSFIVLMFSFGAFQNFKLMKKQGNKQTSFQICFGKVIDEGEYEDGTVYCLGDGSVDNGSVKKFLGALNENTCKNLKLIFYYLNTADIDKSLSESGDTLGIAFRMKYSESDRAFVRYGNSSVSIGEILTDKDFSDSRKITLPSGYSENYIGQTVAIAGENYTVSGINYIDDFVEMPYTNSPDGLQGIENISIMFKNIATQKDYDDITSACRYAFGDYAHLPKIETVSDKLPFYNSIMAVSVMLALISAVTLMMLYKYILQQRSKTIAVFRLLGCTKAKARKICIAEVMLISIICAAAAYGLYFGLLTDILSRYLIYIKSVYSIRNIAVIFTINIATVYVFASVIISAQLRLKTVEQIKAG